MAFNSSQYSEYNKYFSLKSQGLKPVDVCQIGERDGLDIIEQIKMIRVVFGLGVAHAKEIKLIADGIDPEEHWNQIYKALDRLEEDGLFEFE